MKYHLNDDAIEERENLPIAVHNDRLFAISKTILEFNDFKRFVKDETDLDVSLLDGNSIKKGALRHMLALYISDKLRYTSQSTYQLEERRDYNRHYYGHKAAKDLLMLIPNENLTMEQV